MFKSIFNSINGHHKEEDVSSSAANSKQDKLSNKGLNGDVNEISTTNRQPSANNQNGSTNSKKSSNRKKLSAMMGKIQSSMSHGTSTKSNINKQNYINNNNIDDLDDHQQEYNISSSNNNTEQISRSSSMKSIATNGKDKDLDDEKNAYILPEEQCDIPTFLHTANCDQNLIDETRRLLKERYTKNPDNFYENDYKRMLSDDWTVSRFLLRRRLDPKRTAKLMEECGRFRRQYKMSEVKLWEFPIEFHKAGGLFKYAPDRVGNNTVYMRVKMYRRVPEISDVFKAFILCVLEECDVANGGRGTAVIFDLTGCGLQNVDLGFLSWLLSSFRNYCPKGVSYILVYNLPWILNATCKLAMTWMSASNRRALRFVYGDEIENFIARENLPDYCNGTCKLNYRHVPEGALPATEVCDRLDMTREQALKIRELFREYLDDEDLTSDEDEEEEEEEAEKDCKKKNGHYLTNVYCRVIKLAFVHIEVW